MKRVFDRIASGCSVCRRPVRVPAVTVGSKRSRQNLNPSSWAFTLAEAAPILVPMAVRKHPKAPKAPEASTADLEAAVLALVQERSGLMGSDLRKELGKRWKGTGDRVIALADDLAARESLYRFSSARKVRYFREDPQATLSRVILDVLAAGPLTEAELKRAVDERASGHGDLVKGWVKGAKARGELYEHAAAPGGRSKRVGREPDVDSVLRGTMRELRKARLTKAGRLVPPERLLEAIAAELRVPSHAKGASGGGTRSDADASTQDDREVLTRALAELGKLPGATALLSIRELRARAALDKARFDRATLALAREGVVTLHHHDFPSSLPPAERAELVVDERGTHYVGIAPRRGR